MTGVAVVGKNLITLIFFLKTFIVFGEYETNSRKLEITSSIFYSYYENYNNGKYYAALNNHSKAYSYYKKSIDLTEHPGQKLLCDFVITCNNLNRFSESKFWIIFMMERFGLEYMFFEYNKIITNSNKGFFSEIKNHESEYLCKFDIHKKLKEIDEIKYLYRIRIFYNDELKRLNEGNTNLEKINVVNSLLKRINETEISQLINKLINKYNFPNEYDLGFVGHGMFVELFRDLYIVNDSTKPLIDKALLNLKIDPFTFALIIDSKNSNLKTLDKNKASQIFPYKNFSVNLTRKESIITIRDQIYNVDSVDFRRQKIGLSPIWSDAIIRNYIVPVEYDLWRKKINKKE